MRCHPLFVPVYASPPRPPFDLFETNGLVDSTLCRCFTSAESRDQFVSECVRRIGQATGIDEDSKTWTALQTALAIANGQYNDLFKETGSGDLLIASAAIENADVGRSPAQQPDGTSILSSLPDNGTDPLAVKKLLLAMFAALSEGDVNDLATRAMQNLGSQGKEASVFLLDLEDKGASAVWYKAEIPPNATVGDGKPNSFDCFTRGWHCACVGDAKSKTAAAAGNLAGDSNMKNIAQFDDAAECACPAECWAPAHDLRPKRCGSRARQVLQLPNDGKGTMCDSCFQIVPHPAKLQSRQRSPNHTGSQMVKCLQCKVTMCQRCDRYWHSFVLLAPHPLQLPLQRCTGRSVVVPYSSGPENNWKQALNVQQDGAGAALIVRKPLPHSLGKARPVWGRQKSLPLAPDAPQYYENADAEVKLWRVGQARRLPIRVTTGAAKSVHPAASDAPWGWDVTRAAKFERTVDLASTDAAHTLELLKTSNKSAVAQLYRIKRMPRPWVAQTTLIPLQVDKINEDDAFVLFVREVDPLKLGEVAPEASTPPQSNAKAKAARHEERMLARVTTGFAVYVWHGKWCSEQEKRQAEKFQKSELRRALFLQHEVDPDNENWTPEKFEPIVIDQDVGDLEEEAKFWAHFPDGRRPNKIKRQDDGANVYVIAARQSGNLPPKLFVWHQPGAVCSHAVLQNAVGFAKSYGEYWAGAHNKSPPTVPLRVLEGSEPPDFPMIEDNEVPEGAQHRAAMKETWPFVATRTMWTGNKRPVVIPTLILIDRDGADAAGNGRAAAALTTLYSNMRKLGPLGSTTRSMTPMKAMYMCEHGMPGLGAAASSELTSIFPARAGVGKTLEYLGAIASGAETWIDWVAPANILAQVQEVAGPWLTKEVLSLLVTTFLDAYAGKGKTLEPMKLIELFYLCSDALGEPMKSMIEKMYRVFSAVRAAVTNATKEIMKPILSAEAKINEKAGDDRQTAGPASGTEPAIFFYDLALQGTDFAHGVNGPDGNADVTRIIRAQIKNGLKEDPLNSEWPKSHRDLILTDVVQSLGVVTMVISAFEKFADLFTAHKLQVAKKLREQQKKQDASARKNGVKSDGLSAPDTLGAALGEAQDQAHQARAAVLEPPTVPVITDDEIAERVASVLGQEIVAQVTVSLRAKTAAIIQEKSDSSKRAQFVYVPGVTPVLSGDSERPPLSPDVTSPWNSLEDIIVKLTEGYCWHFAKYMLFKLWKSVSGAADEAIGDRVQDPFSALMAASGGAADEVLKHVAIAVDLLGSLHKAVGGTPEEIAEAGTQVAVALGIFAGLDPAFVNGVLKLAQGRLEPSDAKGLAPYIVNFAGKAGAGKEAAAIADTAAEVDSAVAESETATESASNAELLEALVGLISGDLAAAKPLARRFGDFNEDYMNKLTDAVVTAQAFLNTGKKKAKKLANKMDLGDDEKLDPAKLFQKADVDKSGSIDFDEFYVSFAAPIATCVHFFGPKTPSATLTWRVAPPPSPTLFPSLLFSPPPTVLHLVASSYELSPCRNSTNHCRI